MTFTKVDNSTIKLLLNSTSEGVYILNSDRKLIYFNDRFLEITGHERNSAFGTIPTSLENGWHDAGFYERLWTGLETNKFWEDEVWDSHLIDNSLYVLNQRVIRFRHMLGKRYLGIISDVTLKLKAQQELKYLERIDQSTNITNRFFGEKKLEEYLLKKKDKVAVILIGLNNFSIIPETFGHNQGDLVLKDIAFRIKECMNNDHLFSFGLDRFVLYYPYKNVENIESKAFEIIDVFYEPFNIKDNDFFLSANLGISLLNLDGSSTDELIRNAGSAMQESRKEDFNTFSFYESKMNESVFEQFQLLSDLRKSIERKELKMVYQPQVDSNLNKVVGAEALIRWNNSERGAVPPGKFIPIAEKKGLMTPIGEWVLRNTCEQFKIWTDNKIHNTTMAINISGVQFNDKRLIPLVKHIFYNKVDTSLIELEITESAFVDDVESAIKKMKSLKDMGFKLAIDDFGTGFSSLNYLKKFPIDKLKIDKSFIDNIINEPGDTAIVKSIITLADNLGLNVIAEGVETIEQRDYVKNIGCPLIQGYYYSKPLEENEFMQFSTEVINK